MLNLTSFANSQTTSKVFFCFISTEETRSGLNIFQKRTRIVPFLGCFAIFQGFTDNLVFKWIKLLEVQYYP